MAGLTWNSCLVYIDDVIIFGKTFDEHLQRLELVLSRIQTAKLTLNNQKCKFAMQRLEHLGHVISRDGIQPNPVKVAAVQGILPPTSIKELQHFLGMTGWFRRFIKDYATIAAPLYNLTKKNSTYNWTLSCQDAFQQLKKELVSEPLLIFPRLDEPFIIQCDASNQQIGAVLLQERDNTLRPVQYLSHTLDALQINYCITEKECFAMYYAIQAFQKYIRGQRFVVESDHSCLQWLHKHADHNRRLMRWSLNLSDYDFVIVYRKGNTNVIADALSRLAIVQPATHLPVNADHEWIGEDGIPVVMTICPVQSRPNFGPADCGLIGTCVEVPAIWFGVDWARATNINATYRMSISGFKKGARPSQDRWIASYIDPSTQVVDTYEMKYEAVKFYGIQSQSQQPSCETKSAGIHSQSDHNVKLPTNFVEIHSQSDRPDCAANLFGIYPQPNCNAEPSGIHSLTEQSQPSRRDNLSGFHIQPNVRGQEPGLHENNNMHIVSGSTSTAVQNFSEAGDAHQPTNSMLRPTDHLVAASAGGLGERKENMPTLTIDSPQRRSISHHSSSAQRRECSDDMIEANQVNPSPILPNGISSSRRGLEVCADKDSAPVLGTSQEEGVPPYQTLPSLSSSSFMPTHHAEQHHSSPSISISSLPTIEELRQEQHKDPTIRFWLDWLLDNKKPTKDPTKPWLFQWWQRDQDRIVLNENDVLVRTAHLQTTARSQIIRQFLIPRCFIRQVLFWFHDRTSHFGFDRCYNKLRLTCYWLGLDKDLRQYINACTCHNIKYKHPSDNALLGDLTASSPNELVAIDCAGPLRVTSQGNTHVVVMVDHFLKFIEVCAVTQPTGAIILECLLQRWILRYGPPTRLLSDNGSEFQNSDVKDKLCKTFGIDKIYITPLHPQGNGVVERMMRPMKTALTVFMTTESSRNWDETLASFAYAYNTTMHATTGEVPYYLWFGRPPPAIIPLEATDTAPTSGPDNAVEQYKREAILDLQRAYIQVFDKLRAKSTSAKAEHDNKVEIELWQPGDLVYLHSPQESAKTGMRKLYNPWVGPLQVIRVLSDTSILIRCPTRNDPGAIKTVHSARLRRYHAPFAQAHQQPNRPFVFPQTLLSRRSVKGTVQYKVRWHSLRFKPDSWVHADQLPDQLIQTFDLRRQRPIEVVVQQADAAA